MTIVTIDTGPRNARTDPGTGMRFYRFQGRDLPSVTSLRRMAGVAHGLHEWMLGNVISHALDHLPEISERLSSGNPVELKRVRSEMRKASSGHRDRAAELGTAVHDAASRGLAPDTLPDPFTFRKDGDRVEIPAAAIAPRLGWYRDWLERSRAEIVASEFQVANLTVGYAGSCDLLVRFPSGSLWVVDIKTGKGTYPEHALQTLAYARAEVVFHDDRVDEALTDALHQASGIAVLHLADTGWTFEAMRPTDELWEAFLGLHRFAMWAHANPGMERLVYGRRSSEEAA